MLAVLGTILLIIVVFLGIVFLTERYFRNDNEFEQLYHRLQPMMDRYTDSASPVSLIKFWIIQAMMDSVGTEMAYPRSDISAALTMMSRGMPYFMIRKYADILGWDQDKIRETWDEIKNEAMNENSSII